MQVVNSKLLFSGEIRRPFLEKCGSPFFLVLRRAGDSEQRSFKIKPFLLRHFDAVIHGFQAVLNGEWSILDDGLCDCFSAGD